MMEEEDNSSIFSYEPSPDSTPKSISLNGRALSWGVLTDERTFIQEHIIYGEVKCEINYLLRRIILYFRIKKHQYKAEFNFKTLSKRQVLADYLRKKERDNSDNSNRHQQQQQQQQQESNGNNNDCNNNNDNSNNGNENGNNNNTNNSNKKGKKRRRSRNNNAKKDELDYEDAQVLFFTFRLKYPPQYWRCTDKRKTSQQNCWERITEIPVGLLSDNDNTDDSATISPLCELVRVSHRHQRSSDSNKYIPLGSCIVLRMSFENKPSIRKKYIEVYNSGKKYRLVRQLRLSQSVIPTKNLNPVQPHPVHHDPNDVEAGFIKYYALQSCISRYLLNERQLDNVFYRYYANIDPEKAAQVLQTMLATKKRGDHGFRKTLGELLKYVSEQDPRFHVEQNQQKRSSLSRKEEKRRQKQNQRQQDKLVKVNKVSITPTSIRLEHPKNETTNRVLRRFKTNLNRFLRVQFIDENESRIHNSLRPQHNHTLLYRRIERVLRYGIDIDGRHYTFLAFSASQLRRHGCWFFSNTENLTTDDIRTWMGDFSCDNVVAKCAARMGQCFSSTQEVANIRDEEIMRIPDIKRNGYTFSDGVGLISQEMAEKVAGESDRDNIRPLASAFQFRLGGAKGMLTVVSNDKKNNKRLGKNKKLALRESQIKFESKYIKLEIIRSASTSPTYLNRQVVLLLSSLGVDNEIFLTLLNNMKEQLDKVLTDPIHCADMLRANGDEFGIYGNMARLVDGGFLKAKDPFITNLVQMFRVSKLREAKKKARIHVPNAITVTGVLDETNTLKENQIFCQLSTRKKKNRVIKGPCVLYRCPSLHPGDIRIVEAVDCPDLHDLYDVVVFPQQGSRDLPSMCSGGDLDGDIYSIIWDPRLFPAIRDKEPMNDQRIEPPKVEGCVSINDIKRFFVDYIINDNLGQIANAHMAIADNSSENAFDSRCINLAELHSVAVDFAKTGFVAKLENHHRPKRYPDFMEKTDKVTYKSEKILGHLYRAIEATEFEKYRNKLELDTKYYDSRMFAKGMVKYILSAREEKKQYDQDLRELMNQYGIATESELISGSIVNWLKGEDGPDKFHDTRWEVRREVTRLRDDWRRVHFPRLLSSKKHHQRKAFTPTPEEKCKAAAFYYVTYHHSEQYEKKKRKRMLSFPWLAQEILCVLAKKNHFSNKPIDTIPESDILSFACNSRGNNRKSIGAATATIPDE